MNEARLATSRCMNSIDSEVPSVMKVSGSDRPRSPRLRLAPVWLCSIVAASALTAGAALRAQEATEAPAQTPPAAAAEPAAAQPGAGASGDATGMAVEGATPAPEFKSIDQEVQALKKEVVELNKDLFVLEEELLFPANTQVAIFVSLDVGTFFGVDSVTLKIDDKEVANYLYTAREAEALMRGGVHRMYIGNLKVGKHELVAFFTGKGTHERDYKRGATVKFEKSIGAKYVELKISDRVRKMQPEFVIKEWE